MRTLIAALAALAVASVATAASTSDGQNPPPKHPRAAPHCEAGVSKLCGKGCIPLKRTCNVATDSSPTGH
jgi:Spy/CpxP family protein refolding chaperone